MDAKYDVIIIGAGVAGLVCGCYLAKNSVKVLLLEQHNIPGGYCTAFRRNGYEFDVGVHYIGSCREGGHVSRILNDLSPNVELIRSDPTDKILLPDYKIYIRQDARKTQKEFIANFPDEKESIKNFFSFIQNVDLHEIYRRTRGLTYQRFLDGFFHNPHLKSALSVPLFNIAVPPSKAAALTALCLYREYIFDGGYYPKGGIQALPNALSELLKKNGGEIKLSTRVERIVTQEQKVKGVVINGEAIFANYVVGACDAISIFGKLLDIDSDERTRIAHLTPSASCFAVYLGVKADMNQVLEDTCTTWLFSTYDIDSCYDECLTDVCEKKRIKYVFCTFPSTKEPSLAPNGKSTIGLLILAPAGKSPLIYDKSFWQINKNTLIDLLIEKAKGIVPNIDKIIEIKVGATPLTFGRFTSNTKGASCGWASTTQQLDNTLLPSTTSIEGLLMAGHWCTTGAGQGGVSVSMHSGRIAAELILNTVRRQRRHRD